MSNNTLKTSLEDDAPTWNMSQLLQTVGVVGLAVGAVLTCSKIEDKFKPKGVNTQGSFIKAFVDKKETFQGLPIIRIGNIEEIHTLKQSGKSGWYVFQEGNTITYLKVRSGITEFNTYTLTQ